MALHSGQWAPVSSFYPHPEASSSPLPSELSAPTLVVTPPLRSAASSPKLLVLCTWTFPLCFSTLGVASTSCTYACFISASPSCVSSSPIPILPISYIKFSLLNSVVSTFETSLKNQGIKSSVYDEYNHMKLCKN